jgi:hypothetical protein
VVSREANSIHAFSLGGTTQVLLEDSTIPDFMLENLEFRGVTFAEFKVAAVAGGPDDTTNVFFIESSFEVSIRLYFLLKTSV